MRGPWPWILSVLAAVAAGVAVVWFLYPAPLRPRTVVVPSLHGIPGDDAVLELSSLGLRGRFGPELADPLVPRRAVSWQSPAPGTAVPESTIVRIGLSSGPPLVVVPDVRELDRETATEVLGAAGLTVGRTDSTYASVPAGLVLRTSPEPRAAARSGTTVNMTLSRGPQESRRDRQNRP